MSLKQNINISDYTYDLPDNKIAKYPLNPRHNSKLLTYLQGNITDDTFLNVGNYIPENSLLVYNNTRVIHARLVFFKSTGARIEIFCLEPHTPNDHQLSFGSTQSNTWICMVGNLKKWKNEDLEKEISLNGTQATLKARLVEKGEKAQQVEFSWDGNHTFSEIIEAVGEIPIPPYLNRDSEEADKKVYQTVYAKNEGSVAAPTAGLHFTDEVFATLDAKNVKRTEVTLHVGAGTFQPVKTEDVKDHEMHAEWVSVNQSTLKELLEHVGNITAVGTTTVRTLESLYWAGTLITKKPDIAPEEIMVEQWVAYGNEELPDTKTALEAIINYLDKNELMAIRFFTRIIIVPGYQYRLINRMITNFHQPTSTLLLLVSAFIGDDWKRMYQHALDNDYRFLSFGDSSILIP